MTDRAPAPADVEAIEQVIYDVVVSHPMWIGDDEEPLDYLPERESRIHEFIAEAAAALLASPALATLHAHERANALRDAADEIPAQVAIARETRSRIGEWLRDRADRQEPSNG